METNKDDGRQSPFCINHNDTKLKNFVTQTYAESSVAESLLKFPVETEKEFSDYQKNVYVHLEKCYFLISDFKV